MSTNFAYRHTACYGELDTTLTHKFQFKFCKYGHRARNLGMVYNINIL